jgi:hypothetical protein
MRLIATLPQTDKMAGLTGFAPAASAVTVQRSNCLSYNPKKLVDRTGFEPASAAPVGMRRCLPVSADGLITA